MSFQQAVQRWNWHWYCIFVSFLLKKARGNICFKWYYLEEIVKIVSFWKKISSLFQYSERTIASTVTNDTSAESSWSQLLGARQTWAWHDQEGVTPTCRKGHWKKKQIWRSKVRMQKKNFSMQFLIFFYYELSVCPLILKSDKVHFLSSLIAKPILNTTVCIWKCLLLDKEWVVITRVLESFFWT